MMNSQDLVTVGPSETIPGISAAPAHVSTWLQIVIDLGTILLTLISSDDDIIMPANSIITVYRMWSWDS